MTYPEALAHLYALVPELAATKDARRFDLNHMRRLCAALGDPQKRVPAVLIGGTNGKGSTAATLASILTAAGYRTGLYTSPHLNRINERIQLAHPVMPSEYGSVGAGAARGADGALALGEIPDERFAALYTAVDAAGERLVAAGDLPLAPSFFERMTAVAFLYFAEAEAEIAVLEVGLGGRLDATNVVEPLLAVLTDIALDHQEYLGTTIREIAGEKCGILREGGTLVTLPQHPEANQAIGEAAMRLHVRGISASDYLPGRSLTAGRAGEAEPQGTVPAGTGTAAVHYHPRQGDAQVNVAERAVPVSAMLPRNRYTLTLAGGESLEVDSPLAGGHQQRNLALAIATAIALRNDDGYLAPVSGNIFRYNLQKAAFEAGIRDARWPGRLEFLPPNLLLDVAHNPAGAWTLRSALAALPEAQPRTLIFSCLRDKDLDEMARILFPLFDSASGDPLRRQDHVLLAPIASPRAAAVDDLLRVAHALGVPAHAAPHLAAALRQARQITPAGGLIVATGSVYLVGEVRQLALAEGLPAGVDAA